MKPSKTKTITIRGLATLSAIGLLLAVGNTLLARRGVEEGKNNLPPIDMKQSHQ